MDVFLPVSRENAERVLRALGTFGFNLDAALTVTILAGSEIVLMKGGPFAMDLIYAPDGIESYAAAKARSVLVGGRFPVASLDDIIASKHATGREKDVADVRRMERFRAKYTQYHKR